MSRPIFLRERLNKSYSTGAYVTFIIKFKFWGKSLADLPFDLCYPIVVVSIVYFAVGLNQITIYK